MHKISGLDAAIESAIKKLVFSPPLYKIKKKINNKYISFLTFYF